MNNTDIIGLLSGIIGIIAFTPYIIGIFKKKVQPERTTWFLLSINSLILFITYIIDGFTDAYILTGSIALGQIAIFILSIKYGVGGTKETLDKICISIACISILIWIIIENPLLSITLGILIDITALLPTLKKIYTQPHDTESLLSWSLSSTASALAMLSITNWTLLKIAYPIYLLLGNLFVSLSIIYTRIKKHSL